MAVYLGQCGAVTAVTVCAALVGFSQQIISLRVVFFKPGEEGRAEIPRDAVVVVSDFGNPTLVVEDAGSRVGRVAFEVDTRIPVVEWAGAVLLLHYFEPRIFAGRLVEVAVYADVLVCAGHGGEGTAWIAASKRFQMYHLLILSQFSHTGHSYSIDSLELIQPMAEIVVRC